MNKPWLKNLIRLKPDQIDRSKFLRLDKNERVIEFESKFLNFLRKSLNTYNLSAYPNIEKIYDLLSKKIKISKNMICLTAGSDLAIKTCVEFFTKEKSKVITLSPTFGMVDVYTKLYNLNNIQIGYDKKLNLNKKKLFDNLKKSVSLVILANPNSPTGTIIDKKTLLSIISKCNYLKIPIVIDEAYYGFYNFSYLQYVKKFRYLIIIRTFSKVYGLAGLRAGYIVAQKNFIEKLYKYKPMYEINTISCLAIEYLLKNQKIIKKHIFNIKKGKNFLIKKIRGKYRFIDTYGNFFHINFGKKKSKFEKILKKNKILTRKGPGVKGFESYLRITLGSIKEMSKISNLIEKI